MTPSPLDREALVTWLHCNANPRGMPWAYALCEAIERGDFALAAPEAVPCSELQAEIKESAFYSGDGKCVAVPLDRLDELIARHTRGAEAREDGK